MPLCIGTTTNGKWRKKRHQWQSIGANCNASKSNGATANGAIHRYWSPMVYLNGANDAIQIQWKCAGQNERWKLMVPMCNGNTVTSPLATMAPFSSMVNDTNGGHYSRECIIAITIRANGDHHLCQWPLPFVAVPMAITIWFCANSDHH